MSVLEIVIMYGGLQSMGSLGVGHNWMTSLSLFTFMHWRRKWQLTLTGEPGGLPSMGSHRVGHDWSDLAAAAAADVWRYSVGCWSPAPAMLRCEASPVQSPPLLLFFRKIQQWQNKHLQTSLYSDTFPFEGWIHRSGWNIFICNLIEKSDYVTCKLE